MLYYDLNRESVHSALLYLWTGDGPGLLYGQELWNILNFNEITTTRE